MRFLSTSECMGNARREGVAIPAFNIPDLPMMEPVVEALRSTDSFGLIAVARPEWIKFQAKSVRAVFEEYQRVKDERFTRLHLDHVPVVDEDNLRVDYEGVIGEAVELGYQSVMVDGSRLSLEENIQATRKIVQMAHAAGVPVEGELGAVFGHEAGPPPPTRNSLPVARVLPRPRTPSGLSRKPRWTGFPWPSATYTAPFPTLCGTTRRLRPG